MQEDSAEAKLKQLESTAREMGASEEEIKARRPRILGRLRKKQQLSQEEREALDEVRELELKREREEAEDFARRTTKGFNPETGKPLDKAEEEH